jgi:hypothetical protein
MSVGVAWGLVFTTSAASLDCAVWVWGIAPRMQESKLHVVARTTIGTQRRWWAEQSLRPPSLAGVTHRGPPPPVLMAYAVGGFLSWGELDDAIDQYVSTREVEPRFEEARGVPALCLWYGVRADPTSSRGVVQGGHILPEPLLAPHSDSAPTSPADFDSLGDRLRILPLLPIWPGLAFNTLFYALLWWLALASVRMVKHNRRYRRGLCPLCRYDLRADYSQGCSECGWKRA